MGLGRRGPGARLRADWQGYLPAPLAGAVGRSGRGRSVAVRGREKGGASKHSKHLQI